MVGPVWREWFVIMCMNMQQMSTGMAYGLPAIITPSITSNSSDPSEIHATREQASWIAAMYSILGPVSFILLPYVMQTYGRKIANVLWNLILILGFVIIAVAPDVTTLIIGRSVQGISFAGLIVTGITSAEYSHPKRRPVFVAIKLVIILAGVFFCHSLGMVLTWRQLSWIGTVPSVLGLFTVWAWPESPAWLAYMGRYDESISNFEWLRGNDAESRKEIREIIFAQKEQKNQNIDKISFKRILLMLVNRKFVHPCCIAAVLSILVQATGVQYLLVYIIEIMNELTGDRILAYYYTMGYDVVKIIAALIPIGIVTMLNRRTLLLVAGTSASVLLGLVCVFDYLHQNGQFFVVWLIPLLLTFFNFFCHAGIIPMTLVLKSEIFPLEFRGISSSVCGIIQCVASAVFTKITSNMLDSLKVFGTFGVYLALALVSLLVLYFILPETKDRTLQDIESEFVDNKKLVQKVIDLEVATMNPDKNVNNHR